MEFFVVCLTNFCLLLVENDIHKKFDLGPDTTNVHQALNILARFCGLHWLLSEHWKKVVACSQSKMLKDGSCMART
ncbi:unnamed protein product [Prunus armeniaca]